MINWSKYFDKIICICYNQNKFRKQLLQFQLERVGILNSGIFEWQITFRDKYLYMKYNFFNVQNFNYFSCTIGHINAIKRAYYNGVNRVLILEDDIRFLKDLNKIEEILQNIPNQNQWDLMLLNSAPQCKTIHYFNVITDKQNLINKNFCKFKDIIFYSAAGYCLNKKGMEELLTNLDINNDCLAIDHCFNLRNLFTNRIFSIIDIGVQIMFKKAQNYINTLKKYNNDYYKTTLFLQQCYSIKKLKFNDYMMRKDGTPYNYGDWIEE